MRRGSFGICPATSASGPVTEAARAYLVVDFPAHTPPRFDAPLGENGAEGLEDLMLVDLRPLGPRFARMAPPHVKGFQGLVRRGGRIGEKEA